MGKKAEKKTVGQVDVLTGIMRLVDDLGFHEAEPRIVNACIAAANLIVAELNREAVKATDGMGLEKWLASDDTGMSSKFMAYVLSTGPIVEPAYPLDPSDFGRCVRFLGAVPAARKQLKRMARHGAEWAGYVAVWDQMEALYAEELPTGNAPKLYALMQRVQEAARKPKA